MTNRHWRRAFAPAILAAGLFAPIADARAVEIPGPADMKFRIDLEARFRPEWRANADFNDLLDDDQAFVEQRIRLGAGLEKGTVAAYFQAQDFRRWGSETATNANGANLDLHLGYVDWNDPAGKWKVRAGRQELAYGEERLVGALDWSNIGRAFDAIRFAHTTPAWDIDGFAARVVDPVLDPDPASDENNRDFFGVYSTLLKTHGPIHLDLYALWLRDGLERTGEVITAGLENTSIFTVGFRAFGEAGGFSYDVEAAGQDGDRATDAHRAWAFATRAGYTFAARCKPHVAVGYDSASGDGDPADGDSREFENLFPTNHAFYGYMDYAGWRNIEDLYVRFRSNPTEKITVQVDYHDLRLQDPAGRWSDASGKTILAGIPGGAAGDQLGQEVDLTLRIVLPYWKFQAGYSHFFAGDVPTQASDHVATVLRGDDSDWAYVMATVRF